MSSEKLRVVVLTVVLLVLIVFGMLYRPADALSQPRNDTNTSAAQPYAPRK